MGFKWHRASGIQYQKQIAKINKKALIAMSGGVDSTVAAYLMITQGFDCIGATMQLFNADDDGTVRQHKEKSCCSLNDVNDARDAAYRLKIPHYVLNLKEEFKEKVINKFIEVYENGGTPNPCIDCNRYLKFNRLLIYSHQLEYDYLVTGHYARIENTHGRFLLKKAVDEKKDQSYVLYAMTQEQLSQTIFPLGNMTKDNVRKIAAEQGFINAAKQDSQDICFVPDGDYGAFLERYTKKHYPKGNIIDVNGNIIGQHRGLVRYTLGQRRGLGVSSNRPLYVLGKSIKDNTVTLADDTFLFSKSLVANDINLIAVPNLEKPMRVQVKTRYLQKEQPAIAYQIENDRLRIDFDEPQRAITPGQAAVLYDGDYVIGGGTIHSAINPPLFLPC